MRDVDTHDDDQPRAYELDAEEHSYVEDLSGIDSSDSGQMLNVGVDTDEIGRAGTFIQKDKSVVHCKTTRAGVDMLGISAALDQFGGLEDYYWRNISPDKDAFTNQAKEHPHEGYFIRSRAGVKAEKPVQACLYIARENFAQNVHNIVVAEEESELHIITGCATAPHLVSGLHVGVSEFYVKKGARLTFTMIHDWGENVEVRPRTVTRVEEGGVLISNYISLRPVGSLQMYPTTYLDGKDAVARFNSVLVAAKGTYMDVGSRVVLGAPGARAEIISRGVTTGG
ncbi:MAG: SufD family Fe-S cluster assembly protein, partial [Desulfobacterales bacterium]|nr:SufD family Fe-S cluster assembly protein [Desulfobacterales bacterium]